MKHGRRPWPAGDLALARVLIDLLALGFDHGYHLDAMFPATDDASQRFPCVEREHVFARFDLRFRNSLRRESLEDRWKVTERLARNSALQRFESSLGNVALAMAR